MKHWFVLFAITICLACGSKQNDIHEVVVDDEQLGKQCDEYFTALTELGKFNGVVYVSQDGMKPFHQAYNLMSDTLHSLYVNRSSQFDIHSVSKIMAKYLLLKLEQDKKLNREDNINRYFPGFPKGDEITIDMLIYHRSGLPREFRQVPERVIDLEVDEVVQLIMQEHLIFEPDEGAQYSNLGYQLLYAIIGQVSGQSFAQQLSKELFEPLDMKSSGAHFDMSEQNLHHPAKNHEIEDDTIVQVPNINDDEFRQARIFSSASDLHKMLVALQKDSLSFQMAKDSAIGHSGGADGIRTHVYADLKAKTNFVLLCNIDAIPFQRVIQDVENMIEGKPYQIPKEYNRIAVKIDRDIMKRYVGSYTFADLNNTVMSFEVRGEKLIVFQDGEFAGELSAENDYTFFEDSKDEDVFEFIQNSEGAFDLIMGFRGVKIPGALIK